MDKMDKPLSDWTLGEVQELCASRAECSDCPFYNIACCEEGVCPDEWSFVIKPRFTDEELAVLRHMESVGIVSIEKKGDTHLYWDGNNFGGVMVVPPNFIPALRPGQSVRIEDVLGE